MEEPNNLAELETAVVQKGISRARLASSDGTEKRKEDGMFDGTLGLGLREVCGVPRSEPRQDEIVSLGVGRRATFHTTDATNADPVSKQATPLQYS